MAGLGDLWWSTARPQTGSSSAGHKRQKLGGCCSTGGSNGGAGRHARARGEGGRLNRRLSVLRDVRNDGDSGHGTTATSVGARTGGQRTDRRAGAVCDRSVRRERRPGAWHADFKMLRCAGT
jgi:hypothetical protein